MQRACSTANGGSAQRNGKIGELLAIRVGRGYDVRFSRVQHSAFKIEATDMSHVRDA